MKKIIALLLLGTLFFACSEDTQNEKSLTNNSTLRSGDPCPDGSQPVLEYEYNGFNFHRPRFDCKSGFWFCFKGGEWVTNCYDAQGNLVPKGAVKDISSQRVGIVGIPDYVQKKILLKFPYALVNLGGNTVDDFKVFNVDDEWELAPGVILKTGDYPTIFNGDQILITVDLL